MLSHSEIFLIALLIAFFHLSNSIHYIYTNSIIAMFKKYLRIWNYVIDCKTNSTEQFSTLNGNYLRNKILDLRHVN